MRKLMPSRRSLLQALPLLVMPWSFGKTAMAQNDDVDLAALARLRPGAPASALRAALGRHWREPAPHQGGLLDIVENSHHFKARIGVDSIVREVRYLRQFDRRFSIDGLRIGMALQEVKAARPDIEIGAIMVGGPMRYGSLRLPGTTKLTLMFSNDFLHEIGFWAEDAVYPSKGPPPYPAMAGEPGAPFRDPNLKLHVLDALLNQKDIDLGTPKELAEHVLNRKVDLEDEGYEMIPEAYEYLTCYPLTPELIARVKSLSLVVPARIFRYAWYFRDGWEEEFHVRSLDGIERCINLEEIKVDLNDFDFRRLLAFSRLRRIKVGGNLRNLEALLQMPSLRHIELRGDEIRDNVMMPGHPSRIVMEKLKARGVRVWVH